MKSVTNFLFLLAIVGAIASTSFYFLIEDNKEDLVTKAGEYRVQRDQARAQNGSLQRSSKELTDTNNILTQDLEDTIAKNATYTARLRHLQGEIDRYNDELDLKTDSEGHLNREITILKRSYADLRSNTVSIEETRNYEDLIKELQDEVLKLKSERNAFPAATKTDSPYYVVDVPKDLEGKVLSVGPKFSFVVLNLGALDGIKMDVLMNIHRGSEVVAKIQVTSVKENLCIAHILPELLRNDIQTGDVAKLALN